MTYRGWRLAMLLTAAMPVGGTGIAAAQTVILVRHAEKAAEPKADPPLTPAGTARADALARTLRDAHLTHVITSGLARTRETAAPAARAAGVTPTTVAITDTTAAHVAATVAAVRTLPRDAVALVVGHSNTIPLIAAGLGAVDPAAIPDCAFDGMLVMTLGRTPPATVATRYGATASDCAQ